MKTSLPTALLIDHDDSFTHNVRSWLSKKFDVTIINHKQLSHNQLNHKNIFEHNSTSEKFNLIVFSPGPKSPSDYPHSLKYLTDIADSQHVLGICLGLQIMTLASGGNVQTYSPPLHGKTSQLKSELKKINGLTIGRYHSMACTLPENKFNIIATSENLTMWVEHVTKKWLGFQFHPESFLTESPELYLDYVSEWISK